jgi:hypothetical protein
MHILFEAIPVKNRECITCSGRLHHNMEAGALSMGAHTEKHFSFRAASIISSLRQPVNDPFQTY